MQCVSATSSFVSRLLPFVSPTPLCTLGCLYTSTPDHDFVIGPHPALPNVRITSSTIIHDPHTHYTYSTCTRALSCVQVYVGAGFSGHGFKFAPAIGSILAQLALHRSTTLPLKRFDPSRFTRKGRGAAVEGEGRGAQAENGTRFK